MESTRVCVNEIAGYTPPAPGSGRNLEENKWWDGGNIICSHTHTDIRGIPIPFTDNWGLKIPLNQLSAVAGKQLYYLVNSWDGERKFPNPLTSSKWVSVINKGITQHIVLGCDEGIFTLKFSIVPFFEIDFNKKFGWNPSSYAKKALTETNFQGNKFTDQASKFDVISKRLCQLSYIYVTKKTFLECDTTIRGNNLEVYIAKPPCMYQLIGFEEHYLTKYDEKFIESVQTEYKLFEEAMSGFDDFDDVTPTKAIDRLLSKSLIELTSKDQNRKCKEAMEWADHMRAQLTVRWQDEKDSFCAGDPYSFLCNLAFPDLHFWESPYSKYCQDPEEMPGIFTQIKQKLKDFDISGVSYKSMFGTWSKLGINFNFLYADKTTAKAELPAIFELSSQLPGTIDKWKEFDGNVFKLTRIGKWADALVTGIKAKLNDITTDTKENEFNSLVAAADSLKKSKPKKKRLAAWQRQISVGANLGVMTIKVLGKDEVTESFKNTAKNLKVCVGGVACLGVDFQATDFSPPTLAPTSLSPGASNSPSSEPSEMPSPRPTGSVMPLLLEPLLSLSPSAMPSGDPSTSASPSESAEPSLGPTSSAAPSNEPSISPTDSLTPSVEPSSDPSAMPSSACEGLDKKSDCEKAEKKTGVECVWNKNDKTCSKPTRRGRIRGL